VLLCGGWEKKTRPKWKKALTEDGNFII